MSSKMAPRLESPTKLKTTFRKEVVPRKLTVSLMNDSLSLTDQSSNDKENKNHFKPLEGTPERGGYETTAVDNQVLVQDSSESAASSSPRSFELDSFGFIRHLLQPRADEIEDKMPTLVEQQRNQRRIQKWNVLLSSNFPLLRRRRSKLLVKRLRKGVPHAVRPQVWAALCETEQKRKQHPGLYQQLVRESAQGQMSPSSSTAISPDVERAFQKIQDTIERDIHRTFPRHSLFYDSEEDNEPHTTVSSGEDTVTAAGFCNTSNLQEMIRDFELNGGSTTIASHEASTAVPAAQQQQQQQQSSSSQQLDHPDARSAETVLGSKGGQASLRRVLKAYSLYDREIGYCQGMNFIAGMFLTLVPEEQAFWMLVAVMYDKPCKMRGLFAEGMRETHMVLYVAEKLVHQFLPRLAKHLDKEHIHVTMYATQWLLTQYTSSFRFDLVTRVWDSFLGEGWKITYRVMLSILQHYQAALLRMSFEEILAFMRELPERINGPVVFDASIKIPLRRKHIAKHEKQWHAQQQQQQQQQQQS